MKNLAFVFWIIGWPLFDEVCEYLRFLSTGAQREERSDFAMWFVLLTWIGVAILVYER